MSGAYVTLELSLDEYVTIRMALNDRADKFDTWSKIAGALPGEVDFCKREIAVAECVYEKVGNARR
jgi:hypothetical protein